MARTAKATSDTRPSKAPSKAKNPSAKHQSTRSATPVRKVEAVKTAPAKAAKPRTEAKRGAAAEGAAPAGRMEEMRTQLERLEKETAALRSKERTASQAAKQLAARLAGLEERLAELDQRVAATAKPARRTAGRRPRDIDPGDSVPEGVAVLEPEPMDQEAETAFENLEEHLGPQ